MVDDDHKDLAPATRPSSQIRCGTVKDGHLDHINDDADEDVRRGQQEAASKGVVRAPASIDLRFSSSTSGAATRLELA
jgi:hypothetical protein